METNPSIPVNILRQSMVIMNKPPPGIQANLVDCLKSISPAPLATGPNEKARLYFLLAWFHAVVQESLRYYPLEWSKIYEFNDSDLEAAMSMIDSWIVATAKGKTNIDPAHIPWSALQVLLKQAVYRGRVDSDGDQKLLDSFVDTLFKPSAFKVGYPLVNPIGNQDGLIIAEGARLEEFQPGVCGKATNDNEDDQFLGTILEIEDEQAAACANQPTVMIGDEGDTIDAVLDHMNDLKFFN